jgi:hypothetical protein
MVVAILVIEEMVEVRLGLKSPRLEVPGEV